MMDWMLIDGLLAIHDWLTRYILLFILLVGCEVIEKKRKNLIL
jgi:hypothetical protein